MIYVRNNTEIPYLLHEIGSPAKILLFAKPRRARFSARSLSSLAKIMVWSMLEHYITDIFDEKERREEEN